MYEYLRQIYDYYGAYGYYPFSRPCGEYDPFPYAYLIAYYMPNPYACCEPCPYPPPCHDPCSYDQPFPGPYPDPFGWYGQGFMQPQETFI